MTARHLVESTVRPPPTYPTMRECMAAVRRGEENVVFPPRAHTSMDLDVLKTLPAGVVFPTHVEWDLWLGGLASLPTGVVLPSYVGGTLDLSYLKSWPAGLQFPARVGSDLWLDSLESPPQMPLQRSVGGEVTLPDEVKDKMPIYAEE